MTGVNPLRGEAKVRIGDVEIVMAATMERLEQLSTAIGAQTLQDLHARLIGTEIATTRAAIRILTLRGERNGEPMKAHQASIAALDALAINDMPALQGAFLRLLSAMVREPDPEEGRETGKDESPSSSPTS